MRSGERDRTLAGARERLRSLEGRSLSESARIEACVQVAAALHASARADRSGAERRRDRMLSRLMNDPAGQALSTLLTDRVYRSTEPARVVRAVAQLVRALGAPSYLGGAQRAMLRAGLFARFVAPATVARGIRFTLEQQSEGLTLPAAPALLEAHLRRRRQQQVHMNLNRLGEAVLGEQEAAARVEGYVALLAQPGVEAISVKISSIASQIDLLAFEHSLGVLRPRLRAIYRAALRHGAPEAPKLVNLDMEAYRDLELTYALFTSVLDEPEFHGLTAGLVLQAYLPDSAAMQRQLLHWASARRQAGAAPVRLRIVKGANLAHERVHAALQGWTLPVYASKAEVDANFKRMVDVATEPAHIDAVRLGVASHNAFDLAYALTRAHERGVQAQMQLELLEGMADPLRRAAQALGADVLLYGPVVAAEEMQSAIAYLVRRLDENTAPDNFLHASFGMEVGDAAWQAEQARFVAACEARGTLSSEPRRAQNRNEAPPLRAIDSAFENEPDTDFGLAHNRAWADAILARFADLVPPVLAADGGETPAADRLQDGFDPSRPGLVPYRFALADEALVERTLSTARAAVPSWSERTPEERAGLIARAARGLRAARGDLVGAMVLDAGKRLSQADAEVSEAIDFCEYYLRSALRWAQEPGLQLRPRGVVLVTPPWNFPLAIPTGGVVAALAAGNPVILKPALQTVLVAERLCRVLWEAGIPRDALQLCVCTDALGSRLVKDPRVDCVVLTGAAATARLFLRMRPDLHLFAETGGKNALIITGMADRDQAILDAVHAAFGHAGQKCSATSLLIVEDEVHDDPAFQRQLRDAAESLPVGSAWEPQHVVTPLVEPPSGPLARELRTLEGAQRWLLEPRVAIDNPRLVSPGIKLGVTRGQYAHQTELFGPVLSVMRARDIDEAIELANDTPYGLTTGLHSLDEVEQARWRRRIHAGNLYVCRGTTGAIVRRQPFGGWKASSFGPGAKAGGPNYLPQLMRASVTTPPSPTAPPAPQTAELTVATQAHLAGDAQSQLAAVACAFGQAFEAHFAHPVDPSALPGELNLFHYRPCAPMVIRAGADAELLPVLTACAAALTAGAGFALSCEPSWVERHAFVARLPHLGVVVESAHELADRIATLHRVRLVGQLPPVLREASIEHGVHCACDGVLTDGRLELLHYLREQSTTICYHRYGNLASARMQPDLSSG